MKIVEDLKATFGRINKDFLVNEYEAENGEMRYAAYKKPNPLELKTFKTELAKLQKKAQSKDTTVEEERVVKSFLSDLLIEFEGLATFEELIAEYDASADLLSTHLEGVIELTKVKNSFLK